MGSGGRDPLKVAVESGLSGVKGRKAVLVRGRLIAQFEGMLPSQGVRNGGSQPKDVAVRKWTE